MASLLFPRLTFPHAGNTPLPLFQGLCAFPITPADADGQVDAEALRHLLRRLADASVDSIGLLGSTGSYPYLDRRERRRAIEVAVDEVGGEAPILVGVGALRTSDAVKFAQDARAAGADAGLLAPMSYTPLTQDEVFTHFETVVGESGLPICIYNNPTANHFSFSDDLIIRLSRLPGVVAIKNPGPDGDGARAVVENLRGRAPDGFSVGFSTDWNATGALMAGGDAWYSVLAGLFPQACQQIYAAVRAGDVANAQRLNAELQPLWDLFKELTSLRVIYAAAGILGLTTASPPRPILPLDDAGRSRVETALKALKLI